MDIKNEAVEPIKDQEISYFRVIWKWKLAAILIPLIAMITAKLVERPIPEVYETKASIVIFGQGTQKPLSKSSFESVAAMPAILQKIIGQLSLKMADGTSIDQTTLTNQLKSPIPGNSSEPVKPGFLFFFAKNENPELAKKIADLWVRLVAEEVEKLERFNYESPGNQTILRREQHKEGTKIYQIKWHTERLVTAGLQLAQRKSELSTYLKRLKTLSNSKVQFFYQHDMIIQNDHSFSGNEPSRISFQDSTKVFTETTLHAALKSIIWKKELGIRSLEDQARFLKSNLKNLELEYYDFTPKLSSGEPLKKLNKNQVTHNKVKSHKGFVSSIVSLNEAALETIPIPMKRYVHIFLAGLISFGLVLLTCVLKAHIDAMRQE